MGKQHRLSEILNASSNWARRKLNIQGNDASGTVHQTAETPNRRDSFFSRIEESIRLEATEAAKPSKDNADESRHIQRFDIQGVKSALCRTRSCPRANSWKSNRTIITTRRKHPCEEEKDGPSAYLSPGYAADDHPVYYNENDRMYTADEIWALDNHHRGLNIGSETSLDLHLGPGNPDHGKIAAPLAPTEKAISGHVYPVPQLRRRRSCIDLRHVGENPRIEPQGSFYVHSTKGKTRRLLAESHTESVKFFERLNNVQNQELDDGQSESSQRSSWADFDFDDDGLGDGLGDE